MPSVLLVVLAVGALRFGGLVVRKQPWAVNAPMSMQSSSPCRVAPDTANVAIHMAREQLWSGDSAETVRIGLSYKPAAVTLVTASATCSSVLASYNARYPASQTANRLTSGYVVKAGTSYVLVPARDSRMKTLCLFTSTFAYRACVISD